MGLILGLLGLLTIAAALYTYHRYYRKNSVEIEEDINAAQNLNILFGSKKTSSLRNFMDTTRETMTRNLTVLGIQSSASSRELDIDRDLILQIDHAYNTATNDRVIPITKNPNVSYQAAPRSSDVFNFQM